MQQKIYQKALTFKKLRVSGPTSQVLQRYDPTFIPALEHVREILFS
jgi:hypothetical protein